MGLEAELQRIRNDLGAADAELEARIEKRLALAEHQLLQLDYRLHLLECRWFDKPPPRLNEGEGVKVRRSSWRRAKVPKRPAHMREEGEGVDPPEGGSEWLRMI